ncbi:MAG: hypothetical protein WDN50_16915 [Bradyrhizobium sp.]
MIMIIPNREDGVSREGDDVAVVPADDIRQDSKAIVDKIGETLCAVTKRRISPRGKAGDVDEQHRGTACICGRACRLTFRT